MKHTVPFAIALALLAATACNRHDDTAPASQARTVPSNSAPPTATAAPAKSSARPTPSSSARATKEWRGTYEAKPVKMTLPDKVHDYTWSKDDGKKASGQGRITLTIDRRGGVHGKATGSLGVQSVTGKKTDSALRLALIPDKGDQEKMSCSGVVLRPAKGLWKGSMRCVGPKAVVIRSVEISVQEPTVRR